MTPGNELTSLVGTSWKLLMGADITPPDDVALTLQFEDGKASGSG
jgi:hypothetical protein